MMTPGKTVFLAIVSAWMILACVVSARPALAASVTTVARAAPIPWWEVKRKMSPAKDKLHTADMKWWKKARFGMFIHWGLYSIPGGVWDGKKVPGGGEWIMNNARISRRRYAMLAKQFDPVDFNASQWVNIAHRAGMKYIVITTKHHDGFCMFNTKATDYNVVDDTPWHTDPMALLSKACRKQGIRFCTYYSIMDWHSPDQVGVDPAQHIYNPTHIKPGKNLDYLHYVERQTGELISQYHTNLVWFDGEWMHGWSRADAKALYFHIRRMDPTVILNARIGFGYGDYMTPEQNIPVRGLPGPWETCMTINNTWGYVSWDHDWKSSAMLIHHLIHCASGGGNFLLNVGPTGKGIIPKPEVDRLLAIGKWLKVNGEAIYGSHRTPFSKALPFGYATQKPDKLFLEVTKWPQNRTLVVPMTNRITKAYLLANPYINLQTAAGSGGQLVYLPAAAPDPIASVVVLEIKGSVKPITKIHGEYPTRYVDPFIGTGSGPGGSINCFPGASMPFGMVQLSPDSESPGVGYHYYQPDIQGFSMTHMSGSGAPSSGEVFFTATTGAVHTQIKNFQSSYSHKLESASPGYYQVILQRWGIKVNLTSTVRCGLARFVFPAGKRANVLVPISHTLNETVGAKIQLVNNHEITGQVTNHCFCGNWQTYTVYFVMKFSEPFQASGIWNGKYGIGKVDAKSRSAQQAKLGQWIGAYVSWPKTAHTRAITVKVGISYVNLAGAEKNLRQEVGDKSFTSVRNAADATWNKALDVIHVTGGSMPQREVFYTALYHSLLMPSIFSDADGRYLGFDGKIHHVAAGHQFYCNYSGWDIYRSEMPLLAIITPRRVEDMCQSVVLDYQQGGWVPRWPQINHYTNVMCGSPLATVMCTAYLDGLHGFNINAAWQGMFKDATRAPFSGRIKPADVRVAWAGLGKMCLVTKERPYAGESNINWINKLHYDPDNYESYGSVSQIQEDCIAYASLYYLAKALGKTHDANILFKRALYYRNVFDPEARFFRPRLSTGGWRQPFSLLQGHGFVEGSALQYQWLAPCDLSWLVHAVGRQRFNRRLNTFFRGQMTQPTTMPGGSETMVGGLPAEAGSPGCYNPYNEPDLEAPFEFSFSGEPWKTQSVVRRLLRRYYTLSPNGIPGNDDCGEMSSWAVMSMMGLYSVDPASTAYELCSPVFRKITIRLQSPYQGRHFIIQTSRHAASDDYIKGVKLGNTALTKCWVWLRNITSGGRLVFELGKVPDKSWGAATADVPPSLSEPRHATSPALPMAATEVFPTRSNHHP
jgi:predicted alpha-1,2-mannosidase